MKGSDRFIFLDKDARLTGSIETSRLVLEGSVKGDIRADEQVILRKGSKVYGDVRTRKYVVQEGAMHHGRVSMDLDGYPGAGAAASNTSSAGQPSKNGRSKPDPASPQPASRGTDSASA